jgi:hypothetical protein
VIIKIARGQPELKVTVVQPGQGGRLPSVEGVRLVVCPPPPSGFAQLSPIVRLGEWGYPPVEDYPPRPHELPAIVYPAFEIDAEGAIVFRLDSHLWSRPSGRYLGRVMVGCHEAATLDIDLEPMRYIPVKAELSDVKACV